MEDVEQWDEEAKTAFATAVKKEAGVTEVDNVSHTISCRPVSKDVRALIEEQRDRPLAANAMEFEINLQFKNIQDATNVYQTMATKDFATIVQTSLSSGNGSYPSALVSTMPSAYVQPYHFESRKQALVRPATEPVLEVPRSNSNLKPVLTESIKRKLPFSKREDKLEKKKTQELADEAKKEEELLANFTAPDDEVQDDISEQVTYESSGFSAAADPFLTSVDNPTNLNIDAPASNSINVFFNPKPSPLPEPRLPSPPRGLGNPFLDARGLPLPSLGNLPASGLDGVNNIVLLRVSHLCLFCCVLFCFFVFFLCICAPCKRQGCGLQRCTDLLFAPRFLTDLLFAPRCLTHWRHEALFSCHCKRVTS